MIKKGLNWSIKESRCIQGGKWTTYREMAEETLDKAIETCNLKPKRCCQTLGLLLDGAHEWSPTMHIRLVQNFGLDVRVNFPLHTHAHNFVAQGITI